MAVLVAFALPVSGQIAVLGKEAQDKVLPGFFSQQGNAATVIQGLNVNAGAARISGDILENTLKGNSGNRVLDGLFTATNRFQLRVWDTNAGTYQVYEFTMSTNLPVSSNGVSRVGMPETLDYKTLNHWRAASNGVAQSGVLVAKGASYGMAVPGKGGTNRLLVLNNYALGMSTTNWVDFTEGVVTEVK